MKMADRTVLVVEDEPLIRADLADELCRAGYQVIEAGNVLEAVGALSRSDDIDALVTDVDMPGMLNGLALVNLIRNCYAHIDIAVVSGRSDIVEWLPEGADFFTKPYSPAEIARYLGRGALRPKAMPMATAG
jgi:DNA-binding response OmpR family regulator